MKTFATVRDAKEFLVSKIVTEAQREGIPLSDIERKMFFFSETAWTLPDITDVNDAFERDYDQAKYEEKIGTLVHNFCADSRKNNRDDFDAWTEAVHTIHREDHYLLVLISAAESKRNRQVGFIKLAAIGLVMAFVILAAAYLYLRR